MSTNIEEADWPDERPSAAELAEDARHPFTPTPEQIAAIPVGRNDFYVWCAESTLPDIPF